MNMPQGEWEKEGFIKNNPDDHQTHSNVTQQPQDDIKVTYKKNDKHQLGLKCMVRMVRYKAEEVQS